LKNSKTVHIIEKTVKFFKISAQILRIVWFHEKHQQNYDLWKCLYHRKKFLNVGT